MLSDIGSYQGRGFETAAEFNLRLDAIAAQVTDGPDDTVVLPKRVQKKDARVHFDPEQVERVETVNTDQQEFLESKCQPESSEKSSSEDDKLEDQRQQLAIENYIEKILKEQFAGKDRELAENELQNRQLAHRLDKEKNEKLNCRVN